MPASAFRLSLLLGLSWTMSGCAAALPLAPAFLPSLALRHQEPDRRDGWIGCKGGDVMVRGDAACPVNQEPRPGPPLSITRTP